MDNYRLILSITLVFLGMLLWTTWQNDYGKNNIIVEKKTSVAETLSIDIPEAKFEPEKPLSPPEKTLDNGKRIIVRTDIFEIELSTQGGTITKVDLLQYPESNKNREKPFRLLDDTSSNFFIAQSGLLSSSDTVPSHKEIYNTDKYQYQIAESENEISIVLSWMNAGLTIKKIYTFYRSSYDIGLRHEVINNSGKNLTMREYRQLIRSDTTSENSSAFIYTFTGGAYYSPEEKFSKVDFEEISNSVLSKDISGGWLAMMQHYFIAAFIPPENEIYHYYTKKVGDGKYMLGAYSKVNNIADKDTVVFEGKMWIGPKLQDRLEKTAPGLELTTDYGWLTVIAKPLFWILKNIHGILGNWGWSIVVLTILIKLMFYRLSATSYRSMAGMRKLSPRLQAIKERYGDDKEKFNKAMMELYQKEKINPVGGCLPILVQIPVFIALYWVLLESVELRGAPFILWIDNLSDKDPYFVLPLIMGASMYVQQKLNPAPPDPMQAKIMMSLPFIFTVFFAFFPSGLVLYWVVNNLLSILQQWKITSSIEKQGN